MSKKPLVAIVVIGILCSSGVLLGQNSTARPSLEPRLQGRDDILFFEGFEEEDWKARWGWFSRENNQIRKTTSSEVFDGEASLYLYCPVTQFGVHNLGAGGRKFFLDIGYEELYLRWYMKVSTDEVLGLSSSLKGNALFGYREDGGHCCCDPCGSDCTKCVPADGTNKFSNRGSISGSMGPHIYSYHPLQSERGPRNFWQPYRYSFQGEVIQETAFGSKVQLQPDQWHSVEVYIRVNDIGKYNAEMRLWVDGNLKVEVVNWRLRDVEDLLIREIHCAYGVDIWETSGPSLVERWEDNIVLAKHYIGPMSGDNRTEVNHAPTVQARANTSGRGVDFSATAADSDGNVTSYIWRLGDGSMGRGQNLSHTYETSGTYDVLVEAIDDDGARGWATLTVTVGGE